ncbi:hypothetical protein Q73A0000_00195 [Kaistella flava (ex Peng et al. 2021)]|uniref:DUF1795 domain-containing protein n=1 Tax=Kaistella flava (ex Peng et al. 2021) TaxID=2038776 RepID=A0A7M2Y5I6_9FLAO|nr:hypothetical protein [Kaistella flava (ex Peng et al. 2021)]QOW08875.1 hypothetical protein Q73A0000_00195 [Kaistella flava (ex Peng et al. 2021)]
MIKFYLIVALLFLVPKLGFSQDLMDYTTVKTNSGEVTIPGNWTQLNTLRKSGQTYLENDEGIIIAVAENQKKTYPFYKANQSDIENLKAFYKWDSDFRKKSNFQTQKIKESADSEFIIWKYKDKLDNVFLIGSSENNFLSLLIYTNHWTQSEKIQFLENLYQLNK